MACIWVQLENNIASNSQEITRGKTECNFDCYRGAGMSKINLFFNSTQMHAITYLSYNTT